MDLKKVEKKTGARTPDHAAGKPSGNEGVRTSRAVPASRRELVFERVPEGLVVRVGGEIDHHSAGYVRVEIDKRVQERCPETLWLDLSEVRFMDSSGLGLIMGRLALVQKLGGTLTVLDPSPAVVRMMALAGLERLVRVEWREENKGGA